MTRRWSIAAVGLAVAAAPACVDEHDVDVFVVLPAPCADVDAARAVIDVTTTDGEAFEVGAGPCTDRLAGEQASGFAATLERLGPGYHRADVAIEDPAGRTVGGRSLPFPDDEPLILTFARPDLPGWPTAELAIALPDCVAGGAIPQLRLTATVAAEASPAVELDIACDQVAPATPRVVLPRGRAVIAAEATCWHGSAEAIVAAGAELALALTRSCP